MKIKVNVGCSNRNDSVDVECQKIQYALMRGVDYISEISLIPDKKRQILEFISRTDHGRTKFCTVPLYDSVLTKTSLLGVIKKQYLLGIRCFTLHLTPRHLLQSSLEQEFVINSRAGNFLFGLSRTGSENPHFDEFQQIIHFFRENNCEFFVGTSLRPGRVLESVKSTLWLEEIRFIREFLEQQGVSKDEYILECGGHLDRSVLNQFTQAVEHNQICVMGPLLTDATNGFDDISSMIGASLLHAKRSIHTHLLLTRDEHIRLPTLEALKDGIDGVAVLRHNINVSDFDHEAIAVEARFQNQSNQCTTGINLFGPLDGDPEVCTMCGFHCPLRNIKYPSMSLQNVVKQRYKRPIQ